MDIINVLENQFTDFAGEVIINNLPSIDGLLPVQRKVLWALNENKVYHNHSFIKLLRASAMTMVYYVFGDMPLAQAMKNMANNGIDYFYLTPKGSFGDKRKKDGVGASPRYIECKLSKYGEDILLGINKNVVPMKRNFDNTKDEPILLPSIIPNIIINSSQSIAVGEASKMPSHNLSQACDSIMEYIQNSSIDKAIEIIQCPDFNKFGGQIIYDKNKFNNIYKTGKGSFTLLGKYIYNKKENCISVIEIPYGTYIEDIEDKLQIAYDKGLIKEITHIHNNSGRQGIQLDIYLKKNTNIQQFESKLRKYSPFESKFSCNFTILDLDGKTPVLMSLQKIYDTWIQHRINCIKNETQHDIDKNTEELNKLNGLQILNSDLDKAIQIIRSSKTEKIAIDQLINYFNLNQKQAEYIASIRLVNINQEWIENKINNINTINQEILSLTEYYNSEQSIKETIISQLEDVKKKYGQPRRTEILYEDDIVDISKEDLIEDYNCKILYTKEGYIKKLNKSSEKQTLKEGDEVIEEISSTNKSSLLFFTNKANRYKLNCYELDTTIPSKIGDYIPNLFELEEDEKVIRIVSIDNKIKGYIVCVFENGNVSKVPVKQFMNNYTKLQNCYNTESKLIDIRYIEKDTDILLVSKEGKALIIDTTKINAVNSRNSKGVVGIKLQSKLENNVVIDCVVGINLEDSITLKTIKGKEKYMLLNDVAPTGQENENRSCFKYLQGKRGNQGNFLINTRVNNDEVIQLKLN